MWDWSSQTWQVADALRPSKTGQVFYQGIEVAAHPARVGMVGAKPSFKDGQRPLKVGMNLCSRDSLSAMCFRVQSLF
jgi:hypothetical protein